VSRNKACDVIVIGGGPAGSTVGALLARVGHSVLLLEKEKFPREHVGESLLPFCYALFEDLGVLDDLKRRFVRKPGVRFLDGRGGGHSTTWCFNHVIRNPSYLSFQVARGEFDHVLLKNAMRLGVDVREQTRVKNIDITRDSNAVTVQTVDESGNEKTYNATFLVDASGRDALIGAKLGWRRVREEHDRTAIWSHWGDVKLAGGLEEGLSLILYMGGEQKGWIWVFPLSEDRVTAGFVAQNSYIRDQRQKLIEGGSSEWASDLCLQELNNSPFVRELLAGTTRKLPIQINGNYSYEVNNPYGTNYAMVGDARGFVDPIFSSGVFLAMKSAYLVADAVKHQLTTKLEGENHMMKAAYDKITGAYNFVHRMIRLFYNPHALTWAEAGADGTSHRDHESALAAGHYMLSGDFFENYGKYDEFFKILENSQMFRQYKRYVIDRQVFRSQCNVTSQEVFGSLTKQ
jgi:hypothetical protein